MIIQNDSSTDQNSDFMRIYVSIVTYKKEVLLTLILLETDRALLMHHIVKVLRTIDDTFVGTQERKTPRFQRWMHETFSTKNMQH
jgi:hypothetical protein